MKRSEALRKAAEAIVKDWHDKHRDELKGSTYYGLSIMEVHKYAIVALNTFEEVGMKPPTYEYTPKTDLGNGIYASHDVLVKIYGKWEPEND